MLFRKWTLRSAVSLLIAAVVLVTASSVSAESLKWSKDMKTAWKTAKEKEQPLLLFVSSANCAVLSTNEEADAARRVNRQAS